MPEESTTSDLVERARVGMEAYGRGDFDAALTFFSRDAVWDMSNTGMGALTFEGHAAIRRFFEDWQGPYQEFGVQAEEILDLGNGIVHSVIVQKACPAGSSGFVQTRYAAVMTLVDGLIVRVTNYADIDEARAAAERLAAERG